MASYVHFFMKTDASIGQVALELAYAFQKDFCHVTQYGTIFPISIENISGFQVEAHLNLMYTDMREFGEPGFNKDSALEIFDYEIEVEFGRTTTRKYRDEIEEVGRLLYNQLLQRSRYRRPMAYALEGTNIAAATFPDGRTRTISPAVPGEDPLIRSELTTSEVLEYQEEPNSFHQGDFGICFVQYNGNSIIIHPLLGDDSRNPIAPGAIIDARSIEPSIVGDAVLSSLRNSSAATKGEGDFHTLPVDSLQTTDSQHFLKARIQQGHLIISWDSIPQAPIYDGPPPYNKADLGTLIIDTLKK